MTGKYSKDLIGKILTDELNITREINAFILSHFGEKDPMIPRDS